jgi:hypothetical protein
MAGGYTCAVADARQVKLIWEARSTTDPIDARKLAELLRVKSLPYHLGSGRRHQSPAPAAPRSRVHRAAPNAGEELHSRAAHRGKFL